MSKFPKLIGGAALLASTAVLTTEALANGKLGLGREALPEEIAAWDVDIRPDGQGLPVGSGSVADGEMLFSDNCAACHGEFAEGVDNWPELAGGEGTLADEDPVKTVGSYWPYLSTAWDYVHRSMPYGSAQTLTDDEVYAIVAYILYSNFLVEDDFVLSNENFLDVEMPNADGFIIDDRAEAEYAQWRTEPCMSDCKDSVEITMRASVLNVTPEDEASADTGEAEVVQVAAAAEPAVDPALVEAGEKVFGKCKACHQVGEGAKNRSGPILNGILGADIASVDGFRYSKTLAEMDGVWTEEALAGFLADPRGYAKGTKMSFAGLKKEDDIAAVTAYLSTFE
ncbi:c-type cytochrome [Marivita hallyeonensis]|uniref:Sulfur dehydrogenase subunit SoxD n=1 Tax=Marivita hallyeonensis TaxID=996342 RepID=A0A1M5NFU2_9RHOB|nr:c-type cytochrome [Marivita hallyeonensis]SHG88079.1 sulfur dehydrogenase subunit SoxD [Marivita hallyeonensis]